MVHIDEVQDYLRLPGDLGDALAQAQGPRRRLYAGAPASRPAAEDVARRPSWPTPAPGSPSPSPPATPATSQPPDRGELTADDFEHLPAFSAYASLLHRQPVGAVDQPHHDAAAASRAQAPRSPRRLQRPLRPATDRHRGRPAQPDRAARPAAARNALAAVHAVREVPHERSIPSTAGPLHPGSRPSDRPSGRLGPARAHQSQVSASDQPVRGTNTRVRLRRRSHRAAGSSRAGLAHIAARHVRPRPAGARPESPSTATCRPTRCRPSSSPATLQPIPQRARPATYCGVWSEAHRVACVS